MQSFDAWLAAGDAERRWRRLAAAQPTADLLPVDCQVVCWSFLTVKEQLQYDALGLTQAAASAVGRTSPSRLHCDTPSGHRTKQGNESPNLSQCPKCMYEGLFSHVPPSTSACIFSVCTASVVNPIHAPQFMHAPLHQLSGSQTSAHQREASCGRL